MVKVDDADEFDFAFLREVAVNTSVVAPEGAYADGGGFYFSFQFRFPVSSLNHERFSAGVVSRLYKGFFDSLAAASSLRMTAA